MERMTPMSQVRSVALCLLMALVLYSGTLSYAQTHTSPLVVFVQDLPLDAARMTDAGRMGVSALADIFRSLGARVEYVDLTTPLPEQAKVVVIVGPYRSPGFAQVLYLWLHLARGNHALFAFDPEGSFDGTRNVRTRLAASGLSLLLDWDYGISVYDTFLAEPWFSTGTISDLYRTYMLTYPDLVDDAITAPLKQYGLPVWVWGARHFGIQALGVGSAGVPLLYSDSAFGEIAPSIFRTVGGNPVDRLELNIGADALGRLSVAVRARNTETGSRVALLGDSELFRNGLGLAQTGSSPRNAGNWILAQRLAAWLLELPPEQWPPLPSGFTWLVIDGQQQDWPQQTEGVVADDEADVENPAVDIERVQAMADDDYLYVLIQTKEPPDAGVRVDLALGEQKGGAENAVLIAGQSGVYRVEPEGGETPVADAAMGLGSAIELRLPVRLATGSLRLERVCVRESNVAARASEDCLDQPLEPHSLDSRAPFDFSLAGHLLVTVTGDGVNIREGPGTDRRQIGIVPNRMVFAAVGRNDDASWVHVRNARFEGWIAAQLLLPGGDLLWLPVVEER